MDQKAYQSYAVSLSAAYALHGDRDVFDVDLDRITDDKAKKVFWIHLYHGEVSQEQVPLGLLSRTAYFRRRRFSLQGYDWSLDDIEHGILRANRRSPAWTFRQFSPRDPRRRYCVSACDGRIHFALNCGAASCPPVRTYSLEHADRELSAAEASFSSQEFLADDTQRHITCSKIYSWYRGDFPSSYLNDPKYRGYCVKLKPYSWKS